MEEKVLPQVNLTEETAVQVDSSVVKSAIEDTKAVKAVIPSIVAGEILKMSSDVGLVLITRTVNQVVQG